MKTYRPFSPHQSHLFPPSPDEWMGEGHLAYFILDVVTQLDLSEIFAPYEREERGFPPHHPQMMVGLLLYGYCTGVTSSRKLEKATWEDVATRVVSGGTHPDHSCIADFRARHRKAFKKLFATPSSSFSPNGLGEKGESSGAAEQPYGDKLLGVMCDGAVDGLGPRNDEGAADVAAPSRFGDARPRADPATSPPSRRCPGCRSAASPRRPSGAGTRCAP
jgi:transposase